MLTYLTVLALALLPAGGNIIGSLLAESVHPPKWLVGAALHAAAGIAIALVSIDLMPRILAETAVWVMRAGSVCLNSDWGFAKWIVCRFMPLPGLASAR